MKLGEEMLEGDHSSIVDNAANDKLSKIDAFDYFAKVKNQAGSEIHHKFIKIPKACQHQKKLCNIDELDK